MEHMSSNWRHRAACVDYDPESWFPLGDKTAEAARAVCKQQCPVRDACAVVALAHGHNDGIWAGFALPGEKGRLRRHVRALNSTTTPCSKCGQPFTQAAANRYSQCVPCRLGLVDAHDVADYLDLLADQDIDLEKVAELADVKIQTLKLIARGTREGVQPHIAEAIYTIKVGDPATV